ncbi:MAG: hypothetical protein LBU56_04290 [Rickettsiales bacterium]|jgi:DNA repair exonuclease SbcCD ATPase subunit|nr:hypothetical protein [Rickettsiales bacterium]
MPTNFLTLKEILAELKGKNSITVSRKYYQDKWEFYDLLRDLMNDEDFKQECIDKSFSESCKKDLDHHIELANQAKKAASKYFERKDVKFQAYYTGTNDADRILNINLTNYDGNEPIRISDILQQEKNISELNVYCDKKHDIYAYRENKKRHYEFKEGAYYEMTSTWPATDKSGKIFMCTMVMNVSSDGITEILKFDGRDFESPSKEFWELIELNKELYIQGLSLYDAVKALLERNKNAPLPDVVLVANNNLQNNESIRVDQDEELDRQGSENNADNSPLFSTNNDASTQTEVNLQQVATQVEIHSQPIATQTKVGLQHTETQTEVTTQHAEAQMETDFQPIATQQEIKELNKQRNDLQRELERAKQTITVQGKETENLQAEKNKIHEESRKEVEKLNKKIEVTEQEIERLKERSSDLQSELEKKKQKNVELEKYNNDLQNEFGKEKQKNAKLQVKLKQKDEELKSISDNLQEKTQELENVREEGKNLKKKLEVANAEKKELISESRKLKEELNQLKEKNYKLGDKNDQLERSNKGLEKEKEQLLQKILDLKEALLSLEGEKQALSDSIEKQIKSNRELIKAKQEIEKLGEENNSLQAEYKEEKQKLKKEMGKIYERITQLNAEQEQKVQELYEKNKELEEKLKFVDVQNRKLKDELEKSKRAEQQTYKDAELVINKNHETIQDLHAQLQKLKQENQEAKEFYICIVEKSEYEIEDLKNDLKNERKTREKYHTLLEEQDIEINNLKEIIENKVQKIENLKSELQNKKEGEVFRNQTEALEKDIRLLASKQIDLNQAYTITVGVLNDPDNVPLKKRKLSRSLSIGSDKESYDNHCHSPLSFISSLSKVCSTPYTGQSKYSNHSSIYP